MKLKNLNSIYLINPKKFKTNEDILIELKKEKEIKEFPITENVKKWVGEELDKVYVIDIKNIRDKINSNPNRKNKVGNWIALYKDYFEV